MQNYPLLDVGQSKNVLFSILVPVISGVPASTDGLHEFVDKLYTSGKLEKLVRDIVKISQASGRQRVKFGTIYQLCKKSAEPTSILDTLSHMDDESDDIIINLIKGKKLANGQTIVQMLHDRQHEGINDGLKCTIQIVSSIVQLYSMYIQLLMSVSNCTKDLRAKGNH